MGLPLKTSTYSDKGVLKAIKNIPGGEIANHMWRIDEWKNNRTNASGQCRMNLDDSNGNLAIVYFTTGGDKLTVETIKDDWTTYRAKIKLIQNLSMMDIFSQRSIRYDQANYYLYTNGDFTFDDLTNPFAFSHKIVYEDCVNLPHGKHWDNDAQEYKCTGSTKIISFSVTKPVPSKNAWG